MLWEPGSSRVVTGQPEVSAAVEVQEEGKGGFSFYFRVPCIQVSRAEAQRTQMYKTWVENPTWP